MSLLALPNETLDQIIRHIIGNAVVSLVTPNQNGWSSTLSNIRLVNRRLASIGGIYLYFRYRVSGEREVADGNSCELRLLRKTYTRQLHVDSVPILFSLKALDAQFPSVTHLILTRIRISQKLESAIHSNHSVIMQSVTHLSIEVTPQNESGLAVLLRLFSKITSLALVSDPELYKGMNAETLLLFPPLPHLKTLYRPSIKRMNLSFTTQGFLYTPHHHTSPEYNQHCQPCTLWLSRIEAAEQIGVTHLAWQFPSLEEVLIHRLVLEDASPVALRSLYPQREDDDWVDYARGLPDVAIWLIQDMNVEGDDNQPPAVCRPVECDNNMVRKPFNVVHPVVRKESRPCKFWEPSFIGTRNRLGNDSLGFAETRNIVKKENPASRPIIGPWDL